MSQHEESYSIDEQDSPNQPPDTVTTSPKSPRTHQVDHSQQEGRINLIPQPPSLEELGVDTSNSRPVLDIRPESPRAGVPRLPDNEVIRPIDMDIEVDERPVSPLVTRSPTNRSPTNRSPGRVSPNTRRELPKVSSPPPTPLVKDQNSKQTTTSDPPIDIPDDHVFIETDYGSYIVPKYDEMNEADQALHRNTFNLRFQLLNQSWRHYGLTFDQVRPDETLTNIHIRYKQAIRYIMARSGADFYKLFLVLGWMFFEVIFVKMGFKASGYTMSQLRMYDLYHSYLIEIGETNGFGEGWSPWVKIAVISAVNAAVFVLISTFIGNGGNQSDQIMILLSQFITGQKTNVTTDGNDLGVPQPSEGEAGAGGVNLGGLNLGNMDLNGIIAGLGGMLTGQMQNQNNTSTNNQSNQEPPANRRSRRANRNRPTYTS